MGSITALAAVQPALTTHAPSLRPDEFRHGTGAEVDGGLTDDVYAAQQRPAARAWLDGAMLTTAFGDRHVIRFEAGEEVLDALQRFIAEHGVGYSFASAIGAVSWIRLGYWDVQKKEYRHTELEEQLEVLSLTGDTSRKDGEPHLHMHGVFGRPDYSTVGGHVMACRANPTLELWLRTESVPLERFHDEETGLDLLDLESRT